MAVLKQPAVTTPGCGKGSCRESGRPLVYYTVKIPTVVKPLFMPGQGNRIWHDDPPQRPPWGKGNPCPDNGCHCFFPNAVPLYARQPAMRMGPVRAAGDGPATGTGRTQCVPSCPQAARISAPLEPRSRTKIPWSTSARRNRSISCSVGVSKGDVLNALQGIRFSLTGRSRK